MSILCIGIGLFFIAKSFFKEHQDNVNYLDVANKINESAAGIYVDEVTRIDSVTLGTHNEFIYNYTIINIKSTEVDYDSIGTFTNGIRDNMQNNSKLEEFLKYGSPVVFKYFGADSGLITEIKFETTN